MLNDNGLEFRYREYTKEPLDAEEIRAVLKKLKLGPHDIARGRDAKKLGLDPATMDADALIEAMAEHPTLIQRPIGVKGGTAVMGRPVENLLEL